MTPAPFAVLHVGQGPEPTLLAYPDRALHRLSARGGTAVLVYGSSVAVGAVRSAYPARRDGEEDGPVRRRTY